jgi:dihydroxyacetone kinase-like protein
MEQRGQGGAGVPVADVMRMIAVTMQQERARLNGLSSFGGNGTHGDRMARAFVEAADAVDRSGTGDAGEELELVGQVLLDSDGRAAQILGQGFLQAGMQLTGRSTLGFADLVPLLNGLLEGAQAAGGAPLGEGTLMDALTPAVMAYTAASQQGLTPGQAIQGALGGAMSGVRNTANMTQPYNQRPKQKPGDPAGQPDPGAAAFQAMLTGLFLGALGNHVPPPPGQASSNFLLNLLQQGIDLGGAPIREPVPNRVESLLGDTTRAGR